MKGFGIYVKNNLLEPKHVDKFGGSSLFLYLWLLDKMTSVNENGVGKVLGNRPITYELVAADLGMDQRTYQRWIKRLRDEGYINTIRAPYGLIITVHKAEKIFGKRSVKNDTSLPKRADKDVVSQTVRSDKSGASHTTKVAHQYDKSGASNKDNTKTTQLDNTVATKATASPELEEISKLFFEAIKALKLPVLNHTTIKTKIKALAKEDDHDKIINYLKFMRDQYETVDWSYKPAINSALDIYTKRLSIRNTFMREVKDQTKQKGRVLRV